MIFETQSDESEEEMVIFHAYHNQRHIVGILSVALQRWDDLQLLDRAIP